MCIRDRYDDAQIIGGTNATGGTETITMTWRARAGNETPGSVTNPPFPSPGNGLASDVVTITGMSLAGGATRVNTGADQVANGVVTLGTQTDVFVLQMTYSPTAILAITGLAEGAAASAGLIQLGWLNPNGTNSTANDTWVTAISGNFGTNTGSTNLSGSWITNSSPTVLGTWGVDQSTDTVWAVLDHNSTFAVIPEPTTVTGLIGLAGLFGLSRRRRA